MDQKYILELQLKWIERSELKVYFLVPLVLAMAATLVALLGEKELPETQFRFASVLYFILAGTSLIAGLHSVFPRLKGPKSSLIYFGGIAALDRKRYRDLALGADEAAWQSDLLDQIHVNAQIAQKKFGEVKFAIQMFGGSVPFWMFAVYGAV